MSSLPNPTPDHKDQADIGLEAAPPCRKLRTKRAFSLLVGEGGEARPWQRGEGSTAVYWCLRTMECAGPDGALVHAEECGPARPCYAREETF